MTDEQQQQGETAQAPVSPPDSNVTPDVDVPADAETVDWQARAERAEADLEGRDAADASEPPPEGTDARAVYDRRNADYYCPGCGRPLAYPGECTGRPESPHPPVQTVSTDEIAEDADPENHTPAPATGV